MLFSMMRVPLNRWMLLPVTRCSEGCPSWSWARLKTAQFVFSGEASAFAVVVASSRGSGGLSLE